MNKIDKDLIHQESEKSFDVQKEKENKEKKIIDESHNSVLDLAQKILLTPVKKGLESLKNLILPEKIKQEVREKVNNLEKNKQIEKKKELLGAKNDLRNLQKNIIPFYYGEFAKKGVVEAAQSKEAQSLIMAVSTKDPNIFLEPFRRVAKWGLES